jgi:hypothetical protein
VIKVIIKHGVRDERGYFVTTFSVIFDKTDKVLEVLLQASSLQLWFTLGIVQASEVGEVLDTARVQGLVAYDADHVLKLGRDDMVAVTLLQHSLRSSDENTCKQRELP